MTDKRLINANARREAALRAWENCPNRYTAKVYLDTFSGNDAVDKSERVIYVSRWDRVIPPGRT